MKWSTVFVPIPYACQYASNLVRQSTRRSLPPRQVRARHLSQSPCKQQSEHPSVWRPTGASDQKHCTSPLQVPSRARRRHEHAEPAFACHHGLLYRDSYIDNDLRGWREVLAVAISEAAAGPLSRRTRGPWTAEAERQRPWDSGTRRYLDGFHATTATHHYLRGKAATILPAHIRSVPPRRQYYPGEHTTPGPRPF